jgi:sortase B
MKKDEKKGRRILLPILVFILALSVCKFGIPMFEAWEYQNKQQELSELKEVPSTDETADATSQPETEKEGDPVILEEYRKLYEKNPDLVGWLSIEDTVIDYPVMRSEDEEYYLRRDFDGNDDTHGCLFVKSFADVETPSTNFIIYGHNMHDGTMFGGLSKYQEEAYEKEHNIISFDTLYEKRTYEIVAVFLSQVYYEDEDVFKYYQFYQADTQEEFDDFYTNIKELSLYDTNVEAQFGDTFLTLSTCSYYTEDGRLAIVAKRIS